jgi:hypothetical protein
MRLRFTVASVVCVLGCGNQALPPVSIGSVVPSGMVASQPTSVSVQVIAQLAFQVDYGQDQLTADTGLQVLIGPLQLGGSTYPAGGLVQGTLPTVLPPGTYNVSVMMADGRTAESPNAFSVDGGTWPAGYSIAAIGEQSSGVPFSITLQAYGPVSEYASAFGGNVLLTLVGDGTLVPEISAAFSNGMLVQSVTVTGAGEFTLTATDIAGGYGQSSPFTVAP